MSNAWKALEATHPGQASPFVSKGLLALARRAGRRAVLVSDRPGRPLGMRRASPQRLRRQWDRIAGARLGLPSKFCSPTGSPTARASRAVVVLPVLGVCLF